MLEAATEPMLCARSALRQELAGRLWKKFDEFDRSRVFVAWAIGFARLLVFEWRRAQAKLPIPIGDETLNQLADAAAERAENRDEIQGALEECSGDLTDLQRKALHQRYYEETPVAEIARAWGRTKCIGLGKRVGSPFCYGCEGEPFGEPLLR